MTPGSVVRLTTDCAMGPGLSYLIQYDLNDPIYYSGGHRFEFSIYLIYFNNIFSIIFWRSPVVQC